MLGRVLRSGRVLLGATFLSAGLVAGVTTQAHATYAMCLDDPHINLSNGGQLKIQTAIADNASDVTNITYNVTLPAGVTSTGIVYGGGSLAGLTTVNSVTGTGSTFDVSVTVTTGAATTFATQARYKGTRALGSASTNTGTVSLSLG